MEGAVTEDEFWVDVRDVDVLKLVVLKQVEEDCACTDKGFDIGVALLDIRRKA